jgi:hypothetical protein
MLHSAGSAIFLAAGAGGREPLPAAQSRRKQPELSVGGSREPRGSSLSRRASRGRSGPRAGTRSAGSPGAPRLTSDPSWQPWRQHRRVSGSSASPSPAEAGCRGLGNSGGLQSRPSFLLVRSRLGPPHPPWSATLCCRLTLDPSRGRRPATGRRAGLLSGRRERRTAQAQGGASGGPVTNQRPRRAFRAAPRAPPLLWVGVAD